MADPRTPTDADEEQELDLGRYWGRITARWWLVLVAVVAGVVIGYLTTLGAAKQWAGTTTVYLGTPFGPNGDTNPVVSVPTQLALANEVALATKTHVAVAATVGLPARSLNHAVAVKPVQGVSNAKTGVPAPIVEITVTGKPPLKIAAAADEIGKLVLASQSHYIAVKIAQLEGRQAYVQTQLDLVHQRQQQAQELQKKIIAAPNLDLTTQLITVQTYTQLIISGDQRISALEQVQFSLNQQLSLAKDVEAGNILTHAVPTSIPTRSKSNSMVVGAIIGLIVGLIAALLWEPVARRAGRGAKS